MNQLNTIAEAERLGWAVNQKETILHEDGKITAWFFAQQARVFVTFAAETAEDSKFFATLWISGKAHSLVWNDNDILMQWFKTYGDD